MLHLRIQFECAVHHVHHTTAQRTERFDRSVIAFREKTDGSTNVQTFRTDFKNPLVAFARVRQLVPLPVDRHLVEGKQQCSRRLLVKNIRSGQEVDLVGAQHGTLDDGVHQPVLMVADDDRRFMRIREVSQPLDTFNAVESVDA